MAAYINGQRVPEVVSSPEVYGSSSKCLSREEKIAEYLAYDLPQLCRERVFADTAVVNLSVSLYYGVDAVFTEQKICKSLLTSSQAIGVTRRRRLYVSHNYLAQKQKGKWIFNPLLMQDEWLRRVKVHQAFEKIVRAKEWNETLECPFLCTCMIDGIETVAWISRVDDGRRWHTLCCLPQNGVILIDRSKDEFPILGETRIKVADCSFRLTLDKGEVVSLMQV